MNKTRTILVILLLAFQPVSSHSQTPVKPSVIVPAKIGYLLEIEPVEGAEVLLVDPQDAPHRRFESLIWVESSAVKGGTIRVVQVVKGQPPKWFIWQVGPPPQPQPVVLPSAKLTVDGQQKLATVKAIGDSVTRAWTVKNVGDGDKVELDGKEVEPIGSDTFRIELPTTLFTLKVSTANHTVYDQVRVEIGNIPPPDPPGPVPTAELMRIVQPIKTLAIGNPKSTKLGGVYRKAAEGIRGASQVTTTEQARQWLIDYDAQAIRDNGLVGAMPGFGAAFNQAMKESLGLDNVALDSVKRARLADTLDAVAWALGA